MSLTLEQFGIDRLEPEERVELIGLIWDSLPDSAPWSPPPWHLELLQQRLDAADADPNAVEPWETLYERLSKRP